MKKEQFNNSIKAIKSITLTSKEKEAMFDVLKWYAESNPSIKSPYLVPSPYRFVARAYFYLGKPMSYAIASLLVVLLAGGSTVFASQSALPGDVLYPVKVNIAEPIQVALAVTTDAKQKVQVSLVDERLKEAEALAIQGRLSSTTAVDITKSVDGQVDAINGKISQKNQDNLDVTLSAHETVLALISKHVSDGDKNAIDQVRVSVGKQISSGSSTVEVVQSNSNSSDSQNSSKGNSSNVSIKSNNQDNGAFNKKKTMVEQVINTVGQKIEANSSNTNAFERDILDIASSSIQSAKDNLNKAQDTYNQNDANGANVLINASERSAQEASISVDRGLELGKFQHGNGNNNGNSLGNGSNAGNNGNGHGNGK